MDTEITDPKKLAMLTALEQSLGVVTTAAVKAGIHRSTHFRWLKDDEAYKEAVDELQTMALDFAESNLFQKIRSGDTTAIIFFLKTKGKSRGYIERMELGAADNRPIIQIAGNL